MAARYSENINRITHMWIDTISFHLTMWKYHFYSAVICIDFTAKYKINAFFFGLFVDAKSYCNISVFKLNSFAFSLPIPACAPEWLWLHFLFSSSFFSLFLFFFLLFFFLLFLSRLFLLFLFFIFFSCLWKGLWTDIHVFCSHKSIFVTGIL